MATDYIDNPFYPDDTLGTVPTTVGDGIGYTPVFQNVKMPTITTPDLSKYSNHSGYIQAGMNGLRPTINDIYDFNVSTPRSIGLPINNVNTATTPSNVMVPMPTATVSDVKPYTWADRGVNWVTTKNPTVGGILGLGLKGIRHGALDAQKIAGHYGNASGGLTTSQKAGMLLQGVGDVMNALNARKQVKLAKQSLNHTINMDNRNYEMARRSYNAQLEDRQRYREAYWKANNAGNMDNKPLSVNEYLNKYGA
ncbi:hypothetical protein [Moraxella sp. ZY200743]|uniref:hypothetical protein n=1 Tax=Moraxella sp. ZY200743 TaxID=2911970 RepID=UPI003D7E6663